ncbi:MAG: hypothetical protein GKR97_16415 [Rhizobiaceae bacterium]|nr:hypothetical protein [Rhizobiaceae bacterium]
MTKSVGKSDKLVLVDQAFGDVMRIFGRLRVLGVVAMFFPIAVRRMMFLMAMLMVGTLASCQSISIDDSLKGLNAGTNGATPKGSVETFGSGSVKVSMIVNRTSANGPVSTGLAYRNGAALAVKDLGSKAIKLTVLDAKGSPEQVNALAKSELSKNTGLLIVPGDSGSISSVSSLISENSPPVIALGATGGKGIYGFLPGAADGLIEGIRYAAGGKQKKVLMIAPQAGATMVLNKVKLGLDNSIKVTGVAPYVGTPQAADFVKLFAAKLQQSDIVAFAGSDTVIANIAAELKNNAKYKKIVLVGREDWSTALLKSPALQGTIIATRDTSGMSLISGRYTKTYSQGFSSSAAYAYDLIAMASGLVRAKGAEGLSRRQIGTPAGFRGTTGLFRFGSKGTAQRLYQISVITNGALKVTQKSLEGF